MIFITKTGRMTVLLGVFVQRLEYAEHSIFGVSCKKPLDAPADQSLSNSQAESIIEASWSKSSWWAPMRGKYTVVGGSYD